MPISSRFRHTITISRWTEGLETNASGHRVDSFVDDPDTVRGWIQPRASREIETDEHAGVAISDALAFVDIAAVITARDRLKEGTSTYQVVGPPRDAAGRGKHLEIDLRLVLP